jgi:hypothetical protein
MHYQGLLAAASSTEPGPTRRLKSREILLRRLFSGSPASPLLSCMANVDNSLQLKSAFSVLNEAAHFALCQHELNVGRTGGAACQHNEMLPRSPT